MGVKIHESPYTIDIPACDIPTFVFNSGNPESRRSPQYFDATNPSKCFSLAEAELYVKQLAHGLQQLGLESDDKILLFSNNKLHFPVLLWGTVAAGCVFTASSPSASASEVEYQLKDSGAKLMITSPDTASTALTAASKAGLPKDRIFLFTDLDEENTRHVSSGLKPWTDIWSSPETVKTWSWTKITSLEEAKSKTAILNYSSGTTGVPKGVEISHYNAISNSMQLVHKRELVANTSEGQARKARLDMSGERWLAPLPMYHAYGQMYYCMNAVRLGAKVFIMPKFEVNKYLLYLDVYRISFMTAVPVVMALLSKQSHPEKYNLKAIENILTGSAPLNPEIGRAVEQMYLRPGAVVRQGYGLTETTCSICGFALDDDYDFKSVGWLNANCKAKIVPVEDRDFSDSAPPGEKAGEIWVAGPNIMKGYYNRPKQTSETIAYEDGIRWLKTGDVGYIDKTGKIYIVDRLKELIKVKGLQVAPAELELALLTHPDVADAAVVGAKLDGNEYPRAFIVRKQAAVTEQDLQNLIRERFAPHKWLTGGVYFIDAIPRTGSGKVIRRALPNPELSIASKSKI